MRERERERYDMTKSFILTFTGVAVVLTFSILNFLFFWAVFFFFGLCAIIRGDCDPAIFD